MQIIAHRKNTIDDLIQTPKEFGVEVDIRSLNDDLILNHDPFSDGVSFAKWLPFFNHKILILNVKEEGLETAILKLMNKFNIKSYFFLDQSFPFIIKSAQANIKKCAVRISDFESIQTAINLEGMIDWVWLDCFEGNPISPDIVSICHDAGFKVCLVSPELHGYDASKIEIFKFKYSSKRVQIDAVCTKYPHLWN